MKAKPVSLVPLERIERRIILIRGQKVILDSDLAQLYGVPTKRLNEQVRRNQSRFPNDFMFQLTEEESNFLRSQFATSKPSRGGRRYRPYAFTEHGALMAANVLNSSTAIKISIQIIRVFIRLRQLILSHADLARRLDALEKKYDKRFRVVFEAIWLLTKLPPEPEKKSELGFQAREN